VAAECAKQQIYVHLDNHISKGEWCCSTDDGNAWWGDTYFNTTNWKRGLAYMATHGQKWPALVSMALRNEPREPPTSSPAHATYNWRDWYGFVQAGSAAVHGANADVLIFLSGLSFDTYLTPVVQGTALTPGTARFSFADFPARKMVLELHRYSSSSDTSCAGMQTGLNTNGFAAMSPAAAGNKLPVLMTEFGFAMDASTYKGVYATCLASWLPSIQAGWFIWVLAGSYYIRSGTQNYDESWGLLNHDWSEWRNPTYVAAQLEPMVKASLAGMSR